MSTLFELLVAFLSWASASTTTVSSPSDIDSLSPDEAYLEPYLIDLVDFRDNPIARRYVKIANIIDTLPAWLVDKLIPRYFPDSVLRVPLNFEIPLKLPGKFPTPLPVSLVIYDVTLYNLNEFRTFKPAELLDGSKFTWRSQMALSKATIALNARMTALEHKVNVTFTLAVKDLLFDASAIIAFDRTRLCEVWGATMRSSLPCVLSPVFTNTQDGASVSGLKLLSLLVSIVDFEVKVVVSGFGRALDEATALELERFFLEHKQNILDNLSCTISRAFVEMANIRFLAAIESYHRTGACPVSTVSPFDGGFERVVNISRVCVNNNAGFALKWAFVDCLSHSTSHQTDAYPADEQMCVDIKHALPTALTGQIIRVQTEAIAGVHEVVDPAFRYDPFSGNAAAFECSGSVDIYSCEFVSLGPVTPYTPPRVARVCVLNQAGFVMNFDMQDLRSKAWVGKSSTYPINQRSCSNLSRAVGVEEGDQFKVVVQAVGGIKSPTDRDVAYEKNSLSATFVCHGSTTLYQCNLMAGPPSPSSSLPQVSSVCIENGAGFVMFFDSQDLRTRGWAGRSDLYPMPQKRCISLSSHSEAQEGDHFRTFVQAIGGLNKPTDTLVEYRSNYIAAVFTCIGSTTLFECKLKAVGLDEGSSSITFV